MAGKTAKPTITWTEDDDYGLNGIVKIGRRRVVEVVVWALPYEEDDEIRESIHAAITFLVPGLGRHEIELSNSRTLDEGRVEVMMHLKVIAAFMIKTASALADL